MNKKLYSVLFSALLASTFIHELRAKCVAIPQIGSSANSTAVSSPDQTICTSSNSTGNLTLSVAASASIAIISNTTANVFMALDKATNCVALYNGNTSTVIVLNLTAQAGVIIDQSSGCGCTWNSGNTSLENFTSGLQSIESLLAVAGATAFKVASAKASILAAANAVLVCLIKDLATEIKTDATVGLNLLVKVSGELVLLLNGALSGLLNLVGNVAVGLVSDVSYLLNVLQGLGTVCQKADNGGLAALIQSNVTLDLGVILGSDNATAILIYVVAEVNVALNGISAALGDLLNSAEGLFCLLTQLGGNINKGVTGVFKVVGYILLYIGKEIQLALLINVIIQFVSEASQAAETIDINGDIQALLNFASGIGGGALSQLIATLQAILNGSFSVGGCNISAIIIKLVGGVVGGAVDLLLVVVINVLILLGSVVALATSLPTLLFVLLIDLNSPCGFLYLQQLGIELGLTIDSVVGGILKFAIGSVLGFALLIVGDIVGFLKSIPVIGKIIAALDTACKKSDQPTLNFSSILRAAGGILQLILGLLQFVVGLALNVANSIISSVKDTVAGCGSAAFYLNINVTVSAAASASVSG